MGSVFFQWGNHSDVAVGVMDTFAAGAVALAKIGASTAAAGFWCCDLCFACCGTHQFLKLPSAQLQMIEQLWVQTCLVWNRKVQRLRS